MNQLHKEKVIILGTSHFNTIGLVQCLGNAGLYVIGVFTRCDSLYNSVFIKEIHLVSDYQSGIEFISSNLAESHKNVIIPGGDDAALLLEKNFDLLKDHFLFQHCKENITIGIAMDKYFQCKIAEKSGFKVPKSFEIEDSEDVPSNLPIPCIIKPLISCIGEKNDIAVSYNEIDAKKIIKELLKTTKKLIVQEYIEHKDEELNLLGVGLTNGQCIIPLSIKKERIHPKGRGSVTVGKVEPLGTDLDCVIDSINKFIKEMGYVGLFSVEVMREKNNQAVYFIEANFRNDALNPFIVKGGVNLPLLHFQDLSGCELNEIKPTDKSFRIINELGHMSSVYRGTINIFQWIWDIVSIHKFATYYKKDWKFFLKQFVNKL